MQKLFHGVELARQRSIALNAGYMHLVGQYCCARILLTSGVWKPDDCKEKCDSNVIGYVNTLNSDDCDLIEKQLVD